MSRPVARVRGAPASGSAWQRWALHQLIRALPAWSCCCAVGGGPAVWRWAERALAGRAAAGGRTRASAHAPASAPCRRDGGRGGGYESRGREPEGRGGYERSSRDYQGGGGGGREYESRGGGGGPDRGYGGSGGQRSAPYERPAPKY
jgi:hypothetical protein